MSSVHSASSGGISLVTHTERPLALGKTEVSLLSPAGSPAVLDDPALGRSSTTIGGDGNGGHSMRQSSAVGGIDDTALVLVQRRGVQSDRDDSR